MENDDPTKWSSSEVRRWLENEGYGIFWPFLEPEAPVTGIDLISLSIDDWYRLFNEKENLRRPSVIKVRRLLLAIKSKTSSTIRLMNHNGAAKLLTQSTDDARSSEDDENLNEANHPNNPKGTCPYCNNAKIGKSQLDFKPERWKTLLAFLYVLMVSWLTAFVMVIVHDRVPDMEKYPPLPDIILDNVPHIPWAFEICEVTAMMLLTVWCLVILFHKHRFILMRRFFSLTGTIFLLRCITMLITSLSVPGKHLDCTPRPYGDVWSKLHNAYLIWTGGGMTLQGVRTCGDYMFSGHTCALTLLNFFITEYTSRRIYFLHTFTWICNVFGVFFILAAHEHYSIDVFVAFYITSRLFMYYHTLANQTKNRRDIVWINGTFNYETQRAWFWFPLFSFFESDIDCKIPNEFQWPMTLQDVRNMYGELRQFYLSQLQKTNKEDPPRFNSNKNYNKKKSKTK